MFIHSYILLWCLYCIEQMKIELGLPAEYACSYIHLLKVIKKIEKKAKKISQCSIYYSGRMIFHSLPFSFYSYGFVYTSDIKSFCSCNKVNKIYCMRLSNNTLSRRERILNKFLDDVPKFFVKKILKI